jgi:hypothetical protein
MRIDNITFAEWTFQLEQLLQAPSRAKAKERYDSGRTLMWQYWNRNYSPIGGVEVLMGPKPQPTHTHIDSDGISHAMTYDRWRGAIRLHYLHQNTVAKAYLDDKEYQMRKLWAKGVTPENAGRVCRGYKIRYPDKSV